MTSAIIVIVIFLFDASVSEKNINNGISPNTPSLLDQFMGIPPNIQIQGPAAIDFYFAIWEKLSYLPDEIIQNEPLPVLSFLLSLFPIPLNYIFPHSKIIIYGIFQHIIANLPLRNHQNSDLILREWNTFSDNITGLVIYEDTPNIYRIEEVCNNQTENDIEMNNLTVAGYIPKEFLKKLSGGKSNDELQNITVRMVVLLNGGKFAGLWDSKENMGQLIGISVKGFCKNDHIPFLKAYFKHGGKSWMEFGRRYIDYPPEYIKELCLLHYPVFVGRINQDVYFDSVAENHCVTSDSGTLTSTLVPGTIKIAISNKMCFDKSVIPYELCNNSKIIYKNESNAPCQRDFTFPNRTKLFYEMLKFCGSMRIGSVCNKSLGYMIDHAVSYNDTIITLNLYNMITPGSKEDSLRYRDILFDQVQKALSHIENETQEHVTALTTLTLIMSQFTFTYHIFTSDRMTSLLINFGSDIIGFVTYKSNTSSTSYDVKLLTVKNATLNYSSDSNVKVIAYITKPNTNSSSMCHLTAFYGNYVEYTNHTLKSDVVGVYCISNKTSTLNVYLSTKNEYRRKEYYLNEGYSSIINLNVAIQSILYIFELKDTICDPISKLAIFEKYLSSTDLNSIHSGNLTFRNFDLLSHIAFTISEDTQEVVEGQSTALKVITFILSSLSLFGIFIIILSALFLKNWYQQRPYSLQLTISVAGETIFFLISESYISQTGYIAFYYFLLSQFIWMLIIGYLQYIRYVKVFEAYELNLVKTSLIGWILPIVITSISILAHSECVQCNFCSKNREILLHFFIIPISIIVVSNTGLYAYVLMVIARSGTEHFDPDAQKARRKATIFLPPILGITWIFFGMLFVPNLAVSIIGSYIFHIIASSQGLMIFVFVVLLDKNTLIEWYQKCICFKKAYDGVIPAEFKFKSRKY